MCFIVFSVPLSVTKIVLNFQSYVKEPFRVRREALRSSFTEIEGVRDSLLARLRFVLYG